MSARSFVLIVLACSGFSNAAPAQDGPRGTIPDNALVLETSACGGSVGQVIRVELWVKNLQEPVTGFQTFLEFDPGKLSFDGLGSCYTKCSGALDSPCGNGPFQTFFPSNISTASNFQGSQPGQLNVSGITAFSGGCAAPVTTDGLIAILFFTNIGGVECDSTSIGFREYGSLESELSYQGLPVATNLVATATITFDQSSPVLECPADTAVGCGESTDPSNTGDAGATDNCNTVGVSFSDTIIPGEGTAEYTISRSWTATDGCGNTSTCTQQIGVDPTGDGDTNNDLALDALDVQGCVDAALSGGTESCECDLDGDGDVDSTDHGLLVDLLVAP